MIVEVINTNKDRNRARGGFIFRKPSRDPSGKEVGYPITINTDEIDSMAWKEIKACVDLKWKEAEVKSKPKKEE
jgi:hypothetical protein